MNEGSKYSMAKHSSQKDVTSNHETNDFHSLTKISYPPLISAKHFLNFIQNSLIEIGKKSKRLKYKLKVKAM